MNTEQGTIDRTAQAKETFVASSIPSRTKTKAATIGDMAEAKASARNSGERIFFIVLEGNRFFWLGKLKLNLRSEETAIFAALDHKGGNLFSCFLRDSHAFEAFHFEALNAVFGFIVHCAKGSEHGIQNVWRCAVVLRALGRRVEDGEDLFVREHFLLHV
jgi:hypothetical protein